MTLISRRSTYIPSPPSPLPIPPEYMIIAETATWRIGCKHPRERGREAGSSELLYQLDGRCYFLSRQPISMRSVKDGQRMVEVRLETALDSPTQHNVLLWAHMCINTHIYTPILKFLHNSTIRGIKDLHPGNPVLLQGFHSGL